MNFLQKLCLLILIAISIAYVYFSYFDGKLDPKSLGRYAGVAQQYIFHYIRNLESEKGK